MLGLSFIRHIKSLGTLNILLLKNNKPHHLPLTDKGNIQFMMLGNRLQKEGISLDLTFKPIPIRVPNSAIIFHKTPCFELKSVLNTVFQYPYNTNIHFTGVTSMLRFTRPLAISVHLRSRSFGVERLFTLYG